jgi:dTDP-4-amino-4,6-dideoxygalactose transaminase
VELPGCHHVYHQYTIRVKTEGSRGNARDEMANHLRERGVGTMVYYPVPVHKQFAYEKLGYNDHLPASEAASREVLSLPVHPALSRVDLDTIVEGVNSQWQ